MYQAIVFLPLIGCLIAAAISLVGARQRHPGGLPLAGAEDHVFDHGSHHAPAVTGGGVIHASHHEVESVEPAAAGSRAAELITTVLLFVSAALSWVAFVYVGYYGHDARVPLYTWIMAGDLKVEWGLRIDTLTVVVLVGGDTASRLVH